VNGARRTFCNKELHVVSADVIKYKWTCSLDEVNRFLVEDPWKVANWKIETEMGG
jgi:hypothetical protein